MKKWVLLIVMLVWCFVGVGEIRGADCSGWPGTGGLYQECCDLGGNPRCNGDLKCNLEPDRGGVLKNHCYRAKNVCGEVAGSPCCKIGFIRLECKEGLTCDWLAGECVLKDQKCDCNRPSDIYGYCESNDSKNFCKGNNLPFCKYNLNGKCGWDMSFENNCECTTPEEAKDDPELNGEYKVVAKISRVKNIKICSPKKNIKYADGIHIETGLGCIPINPIQLVAWIFEKGFGIVGGIAFILLIGAFIQLATSEGDTKKIQGAKEMITSTVTGLLLAIFSIFIIRLLMVTILRIPGLQ